MIKSSLDNIKSFKCVIIIGGEDVSGLMVAHTFLTYDITEM